MIVFVGRNRSGSGWYRWPVWLALTPLCVFLLGCTTTRPRATELPSHDEFAREQLRIHSDIQLPRQHRLLDELSGRRRDLVNTLLLPLSDEPIHVFVFSEEERFREYMQRTHPRFPSRRALFVKNDTELNVFTWWGPQIGDDLRHEVTHGYLHAVIPNMPLWLDEGLAEYFERPRGEEQMHRAHVVELTRAARSDAWQPDLKRLEQLTDPAAMSQRDYAESWLWVHFLLNHSKATRAVLQDQLARMRMTVDAPPLSEAIFKLDPHAESALFEHLMGLDREAAGEPPTRVARLADQLGAPIDK